ncbi:MerR family transcriptional regulator [Paenibacillus sp. DMB20]|uniref:MerR family transcriptional regulator n=1 Tax=Paenibacillus sp. DMB20 TaxID=1642570 RepID=UPI00062775C6|nr:MerR family transcriptional regulator [Paenibacillus sp. DMB20]KKO53857.1 transcriptional regulator [Paenibacillus sp. DMB20]
MHVNEICRRTGLTKKAIAYYQSKGLVSPEISENGYRIFSDADLSILKEIALLRKLDLNTKEIKRVLESKEKKRTLSTIKQAKEIQVKAHVSRLGLMERLIDGEDVYEIEDELNLLDQQTTIKEKLVRAFPGYFGRYVSFHFGQFLNEPIKTEEQKGLYDEMVDFLDNMDSIAIPEELQSILDEADPAMDQENVETLSTAMRTAFHDFDTFWEQNKDDITQYAEFKRSEEYQNSNMAKLQELFRKFGENSGYYDRFIPAIRRLSPAYDAYYTQMLKANEKLLNKLPDMGNL